ncbi:hypothetical protein [Vitreimonas flagellata]|uniref:hypothetical protein n=1 Tax=Vitreimonas flagellata TaxID=2560861 RepID=UPI0010758A29|nr:hypothetical protein [Vitreimonas flagellata]
MWKRAAAGVLGAMSVINALVIWADGQRWYDTVPGVAFTGPYNPHFVQDIGAAFFAAGLGLVARVWRVRYWPAAVAGAGFLAIHAAIHVGMLIGAMLGICTARTWGFDIAAVIIPAALSLYVAFPGKGESHA